MLAILNSLNAHNLPIFQPILMILVSKFMVHRDLSDKKILIIRVAVPFYSTFPDKWKEGKVRPLKMALRMTQIIIDPFQYYLSYQKC